MMKAYGQYIKLSFVTWRSRAFDLMHYHIERDRRGIGDWVEIALKYPWKRWYDSNWRVSTAAHEALGRLGWEKEKAVYDYERKKITS